MSLLSGLAGTVLILTIQWDAFETILVPRRIGRRVRLTRYFYKIAWRVWRALVIRERRPGRREDSIGFFGPISLILLLGCWAFGLVVGFALLYAAISDPGGMSSARFLTLLYLSGETFFTLGFGDVTPASSIGRLLSVVEAGMGFGFLGTVVGYLPTMYSAFSQREVGISLLDARAGSPPTAAEFLSRLKERPDRHSNELLREWERWSAQVLESHISYPQLCYYRSQHRNQSWLGALVAILDSSALVIAGIEAIPPEQAKLTFAMARHALVDIAQIFVPRHPPGAPDRLPPNALAHLRSHLAESATPLPETPEFEERLTTLRGKYEPYAQALARHLQIELPPWIHAVPQRDNWQGGLWDKELAASRVETDFAEHF